MIEHTIKWKDTGWVEFGAEEDWSGEEVLPEHIKREVGSLEFSIHKEAYYRSYFGVQTEHFTWEIMANLLGHMLGTEGFPWKQAETLEEAKKKVEDFIQGVLNP